MFLYRLRDVYVFLLFDRNVLSIRMFQCFGWFMNAIYMHYLFDHVKQCLNYVG